VGFLLCFSALDIRWYKLLGQEQIRHTVTKGIEQTTTVAARKVYRSHHETTVNQPLAQYSNIL